MKLKAFIIKQLLLLGHYGIAKTVHTTYLLEIDSQFLISLVTSPPIIHKPLQAVQTYTEIYGMKLA